MAVDLPLEPSDVVAGIEAQASRCVTYRGELATVWRVWSRGEPLVLLHGASGSWTHWIRILNPLSMRLQLIVPDMPGFGDSEYPPVAHSAEFLAELLIAGMNDVLPPAAPLHLAGFSFGGIIAGIIAARLGGRVRSLGLLGPGGLGLGQPSLPPLVPVRPEMSSEAYRRATFENLRAIMIADPRKIDDLAIFVQSENVRRARFRSGAIPASDKLLRALANVDAPITAAWGELDVFAAGDLERRRRLLASIQRDVDFHVIAGSGHWTPYEAPDQVGGILAAMVRDRSR